VTSRYPVLLESLAVRRGSGGAGRWHGGNGGVRRIRFLEPMTVGTLSGHRRVPRTAWPVASQVLVAATTCSAPTAPEPT
jgi:N-methylhydantoinase B/oxoprolinase/acetone carboxylase alpha subunit